MRLSESRIRTIHVQPHQPRPGDVPGLYRAPARFRRR